MLPGMSERIDLTKQRYGRLVALEPATPNKHGQSRWLCRCDCGNEKIIDANPIRRGLVKSCGCYRRERGSEQGKSMRKHGMWNTPEYRVWVSMKDRCTNPNNRSWPDYGGRGIRVCRQWIRNFESFIADMGRRPSPEHTLERIKNDEGYRPENCCWATRTEQQRNTRWSRMLTINGRTQSLSAWAEEKGLPWGTLSDRLRRGWPLERAFDTPRREYRLRHCFPRSG